MTNEHFRKQAQVFESTTPTVEELVTMGEQAIVFVHGGNIGKNLDDLRYKGFIEKVASSAAYVYVYNKNCLQRIYSLPVNDTLQ